VLQGSAVCVHGYGLGDGHRSNTACESEKADPCSRLKVSWGGNLLNATSVKAGHMINPKICLGTTEKEVK